MLAVKVLGKYREVDGGGGWGAPSRREVDIVAAQLKATGMRRGGA